MEINGNESLKKQQQYHMAQTVISWGKVQSTCTSSKSGTAKN